MKASDCTILVAEDEPKARQLYQDVLSREGYQVVTVENALQAIEELKRGDVDLFITDLKMPVMGGVEALPKIRFEHPDLPIIVVTAYYKNMKEEFESKGFDVHFFNKPLNLSVLKAKIADLLHVVKPAPPPGPAQTS